LKVFQSRAYRGPNTRVGPGQQPEAFRKQTIDLASLLPESLVSLYILFPKDTSREYLVILMRDA